MGCEVYANNHEVACKASDNKVIAEFPDVCLSPPSPPAGPIPVPYPDTSFSKDMQNGSRTVKIKRKEVMLKDQSFYKTSPLGDEAATRSFGANVLTHVITGKTYFVAWSMDVKMKARTLTAILTLPLLTTPVDTRNPAFHYQCGSLFSSGSFQSHSWRREERSASLSRYWRYA